MLLAPVTEACRPDKNAHAHEHSWQIVGLAEPAAGPAGPLRHHHPTLNAYVLERIVETSELKMCHKAERRRP